MPTSLRPYTLAGAVAGALATALAGAALCTLPLQAQAGSAFLFGTVFDRVTQAPVRNARVVHVADGRTVLSDSLGYYRFSGLPAGIVRFHVVAPSYPRAMFAVALANGERLERDIELETAPPIVADAPPDSEAQPLPSVAVEAAPSLGRRYADFERRRATGRGQYLTRTQIENSGAATLQDAVRHMRGLVIGCAGTACHIRMARAPMQCNPEYIVDERPDNFFGPTIPVRDIEALEVYTGPSEVPGEFAGSNAACGVIVLWTKSGPPRGRKNR